MLVNFIGVCQDDQWNIFFQGCFRGVASNDFGVSPWLCPEPLPAAFLFWSSSARSRRVLAVPELPDDLVELVQDLLRCDLLVALNVASEALQLDCDGQVLLLGLLLPSVAFLQFAWHRLRLLSSAAT